MQKSDLALGGLLLFAFAAVVATSASSDTLECIVKGGIPPTTVTDRTTSAPVAILKSEDRVYSRWTIGSGPLAAFVLSEGKFKGVAGISENMLDCQSSGQSVEYPIVLKGTEGRIQLYKEFGIQSDPVAKDRERKVLPKLPHKCFYIGDGHIGMELTEETFAAYKNQGFRLDNLCMVLTSGQIRFDPETGKRLPTYVIADEISLGDGRSRTALSNEYPFFAPPCFARGKTDIRSLGADLKPLGCTVNYHPWSGRPLSAPEVEVFTKEASFKAAGDAGEVMEDSRNLARDASRTASGAKLRLIKSLAPR